MSLKTWKEEFYPVEADSPMSTREAIEHSLRKWKGLSEGNLDRHGIEVYGAILVDATIYIPGEGFEINAKSCSLCKKFMTFDCGDKNCSECPLYKSLGNVECDKSGEPYKRWAVTGNPVPMIEALEKTLEDYNAN